MKNENTRGSIGILFAGFRVCVLSMAILWPGTAVSQTIHKHAPFWYVDSVTTAQLEIANSGTTEGTAQVSLSMKRNGSFPLDPVRIAPGATLRVSLGAILRERGLMHKANNDRLNKPWGTGERPGSA